MPFLSKSRLINISYNDNRRTICDETFDYGRGQHTLFAMDNGLGKTVLIQFLLQPFVRTKRDLSNRKFEGYFTRGEASYIMHELLTENNELFMIGMVIKKDTGEEDEEKLRILAFTHTYSIYNDFDLEHIPFVKDKRILKYSEAEDLIKNCSKVNSNFKYFNFSDNAKRNDYFEELNAHNVDYKVWEQVIRKINNDESGLSTLYDRCKDDESLLREEILPLIEHKLNDEIDNIRENLKHYVRSYQASRDSITRLQVYEKLQVDLEKVMELLDEGIRKHQQGLSFKQQLKNLARLSKEMVQKAEAEKAEFEKATSDLHQELHKINYEESSLEYHLNEARIADADRLLEEKNQIIGDMMITISDASRQKAILEASEIQGAMHEVDKSLIMIREHIKNLSRDESEIGILVKNCRFTLARLYQDKMMQLLHSQEETHDDIDKADELIRINKENRLKATDEITGIQTAIASLDYQINDFRKDEDKLKIKYPDFLLTMNPLLREYNSLELDRYLEKTDQALKNLNKDIRQLNDERAANEQKERDISLSIQKVYEDKALLRDQVIIKTKEFDAFRQATGKIEEIMLVKNMGTDVFQNLNHLQDCLQIDVEDAEKQLAFLTKEEEILKNKMERIQSGVMEIPPDIIKAFDEKNITFEYGLRYLQNGQLNEPDKMQIITRNPLFPYSILLKQTDIDLLKKESLDIFTSIPIPIISLENLMQDLDGERHQDLLIVNGQHYLLHFNDALISEEKRNRLIKGIEDEIHSKEKEGMILSEKLKNNRDYMHILQNYQYLGNEGKAIEADITSLNKQLQALDEDLKMKDKAYVALEERNNAINDAIIDRHDRINQMTVKRNDVADFISAHVRYVENKNTLVRENDKLDSALKRNKGLENELEALQQKLKGLEFAQKELTRELSEIKAKVAFYDKFREGVLLDGDIDTIESRLQSLLNQCNSDLSSLFTQERDWNRQRERYIEKLDEICSINSLQEVDYRNTRFNSEDKKAVMASLNKYQSELSATRSNVSELEITKAKLMADGENMLKGIRNLGHDAPMAIELIQGKDFEARAELIREEITEKEKSIIKCTQERKSLDLLVSMLDPYLPDASEPNAAAIVFDFTDIDKAVQTIRKIKTETDQSEREIETVERRLHELLKDLYERYRDQDYAIKEQLKLYMVKDSILDAQNGLPLFRDFINKTIQRISLNIKYIKAEEEVVSDTVLRYCSEVLAELKGIDSKSAIRINDKSQKLMNIDLPERVEEESVRQYLINKVDELSRLHDFGAQLENDITTNELMNSYLGGLNNVKVIIKKIEKNTLIPKTWKETLFQNSGGEKFVSMFILLAVFLSYMRKKNSVLRQKEERKIIIMDNPFAKTNAEHLLEPMFDIADKYNIQLICFSGIGGSSVYNQFNRIYTAKIINDQFQNKERLEFVSENNPSQDDSLEFAQFKIIPEKTV